MIPKKTAILLAALLSLMLGAFVLFYHTTEPAKPKLASYQEPDWTALNNQLSLAVSSGNCAMVQVVDSVLENAPVRQLTKSMNFLRVASRTVQLKDSICRDDPYPVLVKISELFAQKKIHNETSDSIAFEAVQTYIQLGLLRRADELIKLAQLKSDSITRLQTRIQWVLGIGDTNLRRHTLLPDQPTGENTKLIGRFADLLAALPNAGWYDEVTIGKDKLEGVIDLDLDSSRRNEHYFNALLTHNKRKQFIQPEKLVQPDSYTLTPISLPDSSLSHLTELFQYTDSTFSVEIVQQNKAFGILRDSAATKSIGYGESDTPDELRLEEVHRQGNSIVLVYLSERDDLTTEIIQHTNLGYQVFVVSLYGFEATYFKDVTGDGKKELIQTGRSGSAGFLDAAIYGLNPFSIIHEINEYDHGDIILLNLDDEPDLELIAINRLAIGVAECNQCPKRFVSELYKYDARVNAMLQIGELPSSSEMMVRAHRSIMGLSPNIIRRLLREEREYPSVYAYLNASSASRSPIQTEQDYQNLEMAYMDEMEILSEMRNWLAVIELNKKMISFLSNLARTRKVNADFILNCKIQLFEAFVRTSNHAEFDVYREQLTSQEKQTTHILNLMGLNYLERGQFNQAYRSFFSLDSTLGGKNQVVKSNLSLYFNAIGDQKSSNQVARAALKLTFLGEKPVQPMTAEDKAEEEEAEEDDDGIDYGAMAINFQIIANTLPASRSIEKLDYLIRAVRITRGFRTGNQTPELLLAGALIAYTQNLPDIALKLLDQGIAFTNETEWSLYASEYTYLYASCSLALQNTEEATYYFQLNQKLTAGIPNAFTCYSAYQLSKLFYKAGDLGQALSYSARSFELVKDIRRLIGVKNHKYAFLTGKNDIAGWHFKLLVDTKAPTTQLFNALEDWKLQTFFDQVDNTRFASRSTQADLAKFVASTLNKGDVFLNYFVSPDIAFVLMLQAGKPITLKILDIDDAELLASLQKTRVFLNVANPAARSSILADELPDELRQELAFLGDRLLSCLVGLPDHPSRLIIAPDQSLYGLPWYALIREDNQLIDQYEVSLIPSARIAQLLFQKPKIPIQRALLVAALSSVSGEAVFSEIPSLRESNPNYRLASLQHGVQELTSVGKVLAQRHCSVTYLADRVTSQNSLIRPYDPNPSSPENFLRMARGNNLIHIIAHGVFNRFDPMGSVIFLAKGDKRTVLRPTDFQTLDLKNTEIISLAACQTGQNEVMTGAEPVGFLQALMQAGASTYLLTEWEVDDRVTAILFESFYASINQTRKTTSLRQSLLRVKAQHDHPYYWSGITLYGNPN
ncbi:CHAT domain-containing protein [Spirosoma validum]|uniref:CHAT domain-containing protein n=1 Tax=Spirosoma validum TaxID=2771355 RepID=A0A927B8U0_9BACT|nr:CHAT domain-containing protein [Spirosoma validum]MBD2757864.1 CHAT domain-containing protein [Spirosoma validum]